jgi:PAS domain S-box-containing protein
MKTAKNTFENFPDWVLEKWQNIADILAETIGVPAALIMKAEHECMEVFISSHSENNPYVAGSKENWHGMYCEAVIKSQHKLLIPNAAIDKVWKKNPDLKLGMIAYLGFPLNFPDNQPFGTICILDNKERAFTMQNERLIMQFKNVIELDMALLQSFEFKANQLSTNVLLEITDRKKAEEALKETEEKYRMLAANFTGGVSVYEDQKVKYISEGYLKLLGYEKHEIENISFETIFSFIHKDDAERILKTIETAHQQKAKQMQYIFRLKNKQGNYLWMEDIVQLEYDGSGNHVRSIIHSRDITERKQIEEKLINSELLYRNLFDQANEGLLLLTMDGKIAEVNRSFAMMHGYAVNELKNMDIRELDVLGERAFEGRAEVMRRIHAGEVVRFEVEHYHKDGHIITFSDTASIITIEGEKFFLAFHQDITLRKRNEEELSMLRKAIDSSGEAVFLTDREGVFTFVNPGFTATYGYAASEVVGKVTPRILKSGMLADDIYMAFWDALLNGHEVQGELQNKRKDGTILNIEGSSNAIMDENKNIIGFLGIQRNITDRKLAEEKILELNRDLELRVRQRTSELEAVNKELETFSYSVSHDLKAPLRHISGFIGLFLESKSTELTAEELGYLEVISSSANDMGKLIDGILNFSRLNAIELQKVRIRSSDMVQQVIKFFETDIQNRRITFDVTALPDINGDAALLRQVWINLISNAIKYTIKKPEALIEIGSFSSAGEDTFFVKDNGAGFNMTHAEKLFGVFKRLHKTSDFEGVGIGLANVNRIITRHGGHCRGEGEVGQGAKFYFSLPK